jgi:protein gp37
LLTPKHVKKEIEMDITDEELQIVTDSLNDLLETVITNIKNFPRKRDIAIQDLDDFVSMVFKEMRNIPQGDRRKMVNRISKIVKRIMHNAIINNTFLRRFIEDPYIAIKEFDLKEIE